MRVLLSLEAAVPLLNLNSTPFNYILSPKLCAH